MDRIEPFGYLVIAGGVVVLVIVLVLILKGCTALGVWRRERRNDRRYR